MIKGLGRFMEAFWMLVFLGSLIPAIYVWYTQGFGESKDFWLLSSLCLAMWLFRIFTRKRMQAWEARQKEGRGR